MKSMISDSDISIDEGGILTVRVKLNTASNPKVLCYGTLKLAEEEASKYFFAKEVRDSELKRKLGLIQPNGNMKPQ